MITPHWKQLLILQSFLNDYGLMWVGDVESSDSAEVEQPGLWNPGIVSMYCLLHSLQAFPKSIYDMKWFLTRWVSFTCRRLCCQELPHELWPRAAEDQGAERPRRGRRVFHKVHGHGGTAGEKGYYSTESLQQRDCHVWWSFPLLSGAQHPG